MCCVGFICSFWSWLVITLIFCIGCIWLITFWESLYFPELYVTMKRHRSNVNIYIFNEYLCKTINGHCIHRSLFFQILSYWSKNENLIIFNFQCIPQQANEQSRRFEGILKICKQVNPKLDVHNYVVSISQGKIIVFSRIIL